MTTLISTFYSVEPFMHAALACSPRKIILLMKISDPKDKQIKENVDTVMKSLGKAIPVETIMFEEKDLLELTKKAVQLIEKEAKAGGPLVVNIGGGPKILAQAALYACYARTEMVERIVCTDLTEDNRLVDLPKLSYGLGSAKKEILQEIAKREGRSIEQVADKLDKTRGMIYQHLKELKDAGYVNEKFDITTAGRLALL